MTTSQMSTGQQEARVRPGRFGEIGVSAWVLARGGGRMAKTEPMNLFRVLGRNKGLFRGWLHFAARLMPFGALPRAESELVILRVAALRGSEYELRQHRRIARGAGLSPGADRCRRETDRGGHARRRRLVRPATRHPGRRGPVGADPRRR